MNQHPYNPADIEHKWQAIWEENQVYRAPGTIEELSSKPKAYILDMFPYPSGDGLHVGHPKSYTASDVIARVRRMQGHHVLHAMGWDAFGLPAERAAERANSHPAVITKRNIDNFRKQLKRVGFSYDWNREINTSAADYYQWTQWIFLKLYEQGLAYLADVPVNWCPALGTVLSNEEVFEGKYVETGDIVERRLMRQWMLKITAYAERLLSDLDELDWPESIKEMQRNWIGKSFGANVEFQIANIADGASPLSFTVFTTRPDTLFGATYCILAPEHPLVSQIFTNEHSAEVLDYVEKSRHQSDLQRTSNKQKTGVFSGAYAVNPVNNAQIPIWIADYVLRSYGTGAIMGVPAHDERDYEFAKQFDLPIVEVVSGGLDSLQEQAYTGDGTLVNSDFLNDLSVADAKQKIIDWLENNWRGSRVVQYRLRDWLFSRQRYWGEPFPIIHLQDGTIMTVPVEQLPVELPPMLVKDKKDVEGQPPLARASDDWLLVTLPDGRVGVRETNTMPQWAGSCWYYLRYIDPKNSQQAWQADLEKYWMPVDLYIGGVEHAVLHLLYARFWHKVLYDCGFVSSKEPFAKLFNQGMVLANSYRDENGKYYYPHQVEQKNGQWIVKETDKVVQTQVEKMSKSRLNVFGLDDVINEYGADSFRLYELFMAPLSASGPWQTTGLEGVYRFLQRTWRLIIDENTGHLNAKLTDAPAQNEPELQRALHKAIRDVTEDIESIDKLNTAISKLMAFSNVATQSKTLPISIIKDFLRLISPFAPHICEELWYRLGENESIVKTHWPQYDEALTLDEVISIPIQINGKVRSVIEVDANSSDEAIKQAALHNATIAKFIGEKAVHNVIIVPRRLVNVLVEK